MTEAENRRVVSTDRGTRPLLVNGLRERQIERNKCFDLFLQPCNSYHFLPLAQPETIGQESPVDTTPNINILWHTAWTRRVGKNLEGQMEIIQPIFFAFILQTGNLRPRGNR